MTPPRLSAHALTLVRDVLHRHPEVNTAMLFGSRAKGTHTERSDVDLVLTGDVTSLRAESIAAQLDELPLPYHFDVQALSEITHRELLEHIERVGITIYEAQLPSQRGQTAEPRSSGATGHGQSPTV